MSYPPYSTLPSIQGHEPFLHHLPTSPQQQLHFLHAHRHLLAAHSPHPNLHQALSMLPGTTAHSLVNSQYLLVAPWRLKKEWKERTLGRWEQAKEEIGKRKGGLMDVVAWAEKDGQFSSHMEYFLFLELVAEDVLQLLVGSEHPIDAEKLKSQASVKDFLTEVEGHHQPKEILHFLHYSMPSSTHNILLSPPHIPPALSQPSLECLYANHPLQAHLLLCPKAITLLRTLLTHVINCASLLKAALQVTLLTTTIKYFLMLHTDKHHYAVELFIECYNQVQVSVKYTLSFELSLFLRVAARIGKKKMTVWLSQKSEWLQSLEQKVNSRNMVGHQLDQVNDRDIRFGENLRVERGKIESRWIDLCHPYSIVLLRVALKQQDITIRVVYESGMVETSGEAPPQVRDIIFQRVAGNVEKTIVMPVPGIYRVELDNSYSWLNHKNINYSLATLIPLQLAPTPPLPVSWNRIYYPNVAVTQVVDPILLHNFLSVRQVGVIQISQPHGLTYQFEIERSSSRKYRVQYETDSFARFIERLRQVVEKQEERYQLRVGERVLKGGVGQVEREFDKQRVRESGEEQHQGGSSRKKFIVQIPLHYSNGT